MCEEVTEWRSEAAKTACAMEELRELQQQRMWLSCKYCQCKGQSLSSQASVVRERCRDEKETDKARNRGNEWENERGCVGFVLLRWKSSGTHITQSFTTICYHTCLIAHTWHTHPLQELRLQAHGDFVMLPPLRMCKTTYFQKPLVGKLSERRNDLKEGQYNYADLEESKF